MKSICSQDLNLKVVLIMNKNYAAFTNIQHVFVCWHRHRHYFESTSTHPSAIIALVMNSLELRQRWLTFVLLLCISMSAYPGRPQSGLDPDRYEEC